MQYSIIVFRYKTAETNWPEQIKMNEMLLPTLDVEQGT